MNSTELKTVIAAIIVGVIMVFVGMTAATVTGGVGQYVVKTLNDSVNGAISSDINMFKPNTINLIGTVFTFTGIALLIFAVAIIIKSLWSSVTEVSRGQ